MKTSLIFGGLLVIFIGIIHARFPSIGSADNGLQKNADGSIDLYFGPKAPVGKKSNWVQTVPGKGWNTLLRLYGPLESWFDKTWRPSEFMLVK